jgi:hypothetical protein
MADYNPLGKSRVPNLLEGDLPKHLTLDHKNSPTLNEQFKKDVENTFNELKGLLISKHLDYGPKNISESPGGPINGLRVRMHDKLARINNLVDNHRDPQHESLEDSFKDMANYSIIALLVLRQQWDTDVK